MVKTYLTRVIWAANAVIKRFPEIINVLKHYNKLNVITLYTKLYLKILRARLETI